MLARRSATVKQRHQSGENCPSLLVLGGTATEKQPAAAPHKHGSIGLLTYSPNNLPRKIPKGLPASNSRQISGRSLLLTSRNSGSRM